MYNNYHHQKNAVSLCWKSQDFPSVVTTDGAFCNVIGGWKFLTKIGKKRSMWMKFEESAKCLQTLSAWVESEHKSIYWNLKGYVTMLSMGGGHGATEVARSGLTMYTCSIQAPFPGCEEEAWLWKNWYSYFQDAVVFSTGIARTQSTC